METITEKRYLHFDSGYHEFPAPSLGQLPKPPEGYVVWVKYFSHTRSLTIKKDKVDNPDKLKKIENIFRYKKQKISERFLCRLNTPIYIRILVEDGNKPLDILTGEIYCEVLYWWHEPKRPEN